MNNSTISPPKKTQRRKQAVIVVALSLVVVLVTSYFAIGNYLYNFAMRREEKTFLQNNPNLPSGTSGSGAEENALAVETETRDWYETTEKRFENITSFDGLKLVGTSFLRPEQTSKWMIIVHGYTSRQAGVFDRAKAFYEQGFNILTIDTRGCGDSEGEYLSMGWLERLDVISWVDKIIEETPDAQIILHGISMGGATVMMVAGEELPTNVKCVIEDCGYSSLWNELAFQLDELFGLPTFPALNAMNAVANIRGGYDLKQASAIEQLKKTTLPVMFIHGEADTFIPFEMVFDVYDATTSEKELYTVPDAEHGGAMYVDQAEYIKRCMGFINRFISQ